MSESRLFYVSGGRAVYEIPGPAEGSIWHKPCSIQGMIENQDIVCFSNDWDGDPLSKKHIMTRLATKNRVLWVNSLAIRKPKATLYDVKRVLKKLSDFSRGSQRVSSGIQVCAPLAVPFYANNVGRWLNRESLRWSVRRMCEKLGFRDPITWTFDPASADVVGSFGERAIVYHCVDEYAEFTGIDKTALLEMEKRLMAKADCVIVSSDQLRTSKRAHNPNTFLVTHGVDVEHFRKACDPETQVPDEMKTFRHPVIGFFGLIADWIDLDLIRFLAESRPHWDFVLIGKVVTDTRIFDRVPNIHMTGRKPYALLPNYAKAFDIAMVPFAVNDLTLAANPLKMREYLAAGLPVVATAIPEAEKMKAVLRVARDKFEFLNQLDSIVQSGSVGPQMGISKRIECESWDHKVEELSRIFLEL
jgi:glycosyltransferase involved in cell wall biosynthesis